MRYFDKRLIEVICEAGFDEREKYFHSTDKDSAANILKNGFKAIPDDLADWSANHDVREFLIMFTDMLHSPIAEKIFDGIYSYYGDDEDDQDEDDSAEIIGREEFDRVVQMLNTTWKSEYGHGTLIWVTDRPDTENIGNEEHGGCVLEVDLPDDAEYLTGYTQHYYENRESSLYYVPRPIPPNNFRLLRQ